MPLKKPALIPVAILCLAFLPPVASGAETNYPLVNVDRSDPDIFPKEWRGGSIDASADPLPADQRQRALDLISKALAKYPGQVLSDHLESIHAVGSLRYSGIAAGGTNSRTGVYVVLRERFSDEAIEGIIHAEFSSILLRNLWEQFDEAAWLRLLPKDFHYGKTGVQAIRDGTASTRIAPSLLVGGFLNEYGRTNLENDFNSYSSRLFRGDPGFWDAGAAHELVKAKTSLVIAFLSQVSPEMNEAWFFSLRDGTFEPASENTPRSPTKAAAGDGAAVAP